MRKQIVSGSKKELIEVARGGLVHTLTAVDKHETGLQMTLKLQGPCGLLIDQVLLAHIDILGPTLLMKC